MKCRGSALALSLAMSACASTEPDAPAPVFSVEALQDPQTCKPCHAQHFEEWESSMHAYAAKDPVFTAMNERGQRETEGELGDFCVKCHAPMALELGLTHDGLNLPDLTDPNAGGVTCYFCHNADAVIDDHNRGLTLAGDTTMRAGIGAHEQPAQRANAAAPVANPAHASRYSDLHDSANVRSASLCGSCHDIVNDAGVALERTFHEWQSSQFSGPEETSTCARCHMPTYAGKAAPGAPDRVLHRHMWPGVDTALTLSYPGSAAQAAAIECQFRGALELQLEADPAAADFDRFRVTLTNLGAGHAWPSGAAQDRRAWVELVAYDADGGVIYQSGVIEEGAVVGADEPSLAILRDELHGASGEPVHMFWEAAPSAEHPSGYESSLLGVPGSSTSSRTLQYALPAPAARVTARLRIQAVGLDVIDDFAGIALPNTERVLADVYMQSGNLRSRIRTITVPGSARELVREGGAMLSAPAGAECAAQAYASQL